MSFKGRDILTTEDLSKDDILEIMKVTEGMEKIFKEKHISDLLSDKMVAVVFLEPSTRTRLSFETAVHRLGARPITIADARSSSAQKGESLADTARTIEGYVDCIVIRQPVKGGAKIAADAVNVPVINGGDGAGQHPTQALLDLYTIKKEKGRLDSLKVAMVGDLKFGRTVHSLSYALAPFNPEYIYCAPEELQIPEGILSGMKQRSIKYQLSSDINDALDADILYMTRIQKERFNNIEDYEKLKGSYVLTRGLVNKGRKGITIMHPLPRVNEIAADVDDLPNAAYFRQAHNGVYLRMALLAMVLGRA
ncbi:MAG: aspartate carbamoyltransferase [Spirochaetes bacterium]|nr:aspartate carbamoyltransferase [Spirochaetota bacterium]